MSDVVSAAFDSRLTSVSGSAPEPSEDMAVAKAKGRFRGKQPKLSTMQRKHSLSLVDAGQHMRVEIAELMGVSRTTVYREIQQRDRTTTP